MASPSHRRAVHAVTAETIRFLVTESYPNIRNMRNGYEKEIPCPKKKKKKDTRETSPSPRVDLTFDKTQL